jgi:ectoine hydroxylase-related dioxygenase (phytanoyl-CoA dioxygenase family)
MEADYFDHMIFKPACHGAATPWHQDQAYHDPTLRYRNINFWMPLDDATIDSGCMQFVPGSHRLDVLPHHHIGDDPSVHGLEADNQQSLARYAVACPVPAGGCTMHAAYTLHYAGANTSAAPRRAYILVFRATPTKRDKPVNNYWMRTG